MDEKFLPPAYGKQGGTERPAFFSRGFICVLFGRSKRYVSFSGENGNYLFWGLFIVLSVRFRGLFQVLIVNMKQGCSFFERSKKNQKNCRRGIYSPCGTPLRLKETEMLFCLATHQYTAVIFHLVTLKAAVHGFFLHACAAFVPGGS
ncbi:MAG: hypothetical protein R3281_10145 [Balneolaceae bacterium]|nr:hypothetical protein [Balneolaceae bacterium]